MAQAATNLEQSFADLAERHDLLSVSITLHRAPERNRRWFHASIQWAEGDGRGISAEHGDTVADALGKALAGSVVQRDPMLADEALPEMVA